MSTNETAYTYSINPNATGSGEVGYIHQTSPAWVLTFIQWSDRDTLRTNPTSTLNFATIPPQPLVVENDCIQVSVTDAKSVLTPSMTATLLITDINYETEIAPGDFVFVNMLNWEQEARRVADAARNFDAINGPNDGFKGFFKIQSVRKALNTDPHSGIKTYSVKITGFAFTEFNNSIYFNPSLIGTGDQNILLFASQVGIDIANVNVEKGLTQVQDVMRYLINSFIGAGFGNIDRKTDLIAPTSVNTHFYMPSGVDDLLGLPEVVAAKDAYNYLFGIQQYSANQNQGLALGMNPSNLPGSNPTHVNDHTRFIILNTPVDGDTVTKPAYWNQQQAWAILNQFTNSPLNDFTLVLE